MRKLQRELKRQFPFARIETTHGNHLRLVLPNGRTVIVANTPSCPFFLKNVKADIKRQMRGARPC